MINDQRLALQVLNNAENIILGKAHQLRLSLVCLLAKGHLLLEDIPGVGKTTLSHLLASSLGLGFRRVQFTSDLLPADILGCSVFNRESGQFHFQQGPIFTQVLLADEINRATPKAQSALLEAMEEGQVSSDGETRALPEPFFVIATQNPCYQIGTFPLPESQLDRFLFCLSLGYPDRDAERALLGKQDSRELLKQLTTQVTAQKLIAMQQAVHDIHAAPAIIDYLVELAAYTRQPGRYPMGLSPRALIGLLNAARAWAWLAQRNHVLPEDVQAVLSAVVWHRLRTPGSSLDGNAIADQLIRQVPLP